VCGQRVHLVSRPSPRLGTADTSSTDSEGRSSGRPGAGELAAEESASLRAIGQPNLY
jgi:hypothetical protein